MDSQRTSLLLVIFCSLVFALPTLHAQLNVGYRVLDLPYRQGQTLTVAVWYPTRATPQPYVYGGATKGLVAPQAPPERQSGPYPLLLYSHGYGGSGIAAVFFTEHLAARGWIVVAPDHHDPYSAVRIRTGRQKNFPRIAFLRQVRKIVHSSPAKRQPYYYRLEELKAALAGICHCSPFGPLIDHHKIAVAGHSLGGFSVLGLCGPLPQYHDQRIKSMLIFSSAICACLYRTSELQRVHIPVMYMYGQLERRRSYGPDRSMLQLVNKVFNNLALPKYLLEIRGAGHFSFNNGFGRQPWARWFCGRETDFRLIRQYGIAFLEKYGAGRASQVPPGDHPGLSRYCYVKD